MTVQIATQTATETVSSNPTPDYTAIKAKQQTVWSTGSYSRIGSLLQISGERLIEAMDPRPGSVFLDVAAGNGNLTMAAARRYCRVLSTDYVPAWLEDGRKRAEANALEVEYRHADAEALPFDDNSFENVGSTYGVMFTPNQEQAAAELLRVCAPGGRIGLANWTPDGFIGDMFKTIGQFNPPPAGVSSPARWGTEEFLNENFGAGAERIEIKRRNFIFRFESAAHFLDVFKTYYGPIMKALEAQSEESRPKLEAALDDLLDRWNIATDGTLNIPSEYLEIVVHKKA